MKKITVVVFSVLFVFSGIAYADLTDGLVAHYPFNGNANDEIGTNHGNVSGAMLTEDRFGNPDSAYFFDGIDDFITVPNSSSLNPFSSDFSLAVWMRKPAPQLSAAILSKRDGTNPSASGYSLHLSFSGSACAGIASSHRIIICGQTTICDGSWHSVVFVADRDDSGVLYIDGRPVGSQLISSQSGSVNNNLPLVIGKQSVGEIYYSGEIDDIRIYNRVLSENEIEELFNPGPDISVSPMSHDFGRVLIDDSSDPLDITILNNGNADLEVSDITLSDETNFSLTGDTGAIIIPGDSHIVTVTFHPQSRGQFDATLSIMSDDPNQGTVNIELNGEGEPVLWGCINYQGSALSNAEVHLNEKPGKTKQITYTDSNGCFGFDYVAEGDYDIKIKKHSK